MTLESELCDTLQWNLITIEISTVETESKATMLEGLYFQRPHLTPGVVNQQNSMLEINIDSIDIDQNQSLTAID